MKKTFSVGQIFTGSFDDRNVGWVDTNYEVVKRTKFFITVKNLRDGDFKRCKIMSCHRVGAESIEPSYTEVLIAGENK